jgi:hypothetical protein
MLKKNSSFNDFAIILTWPDATIRGDEKWMMFFKKIGIVKNLNFKVGHTGIVIVNHKNGEMLFYDFGRYITPRGYGRARSKFSDPRLEIKVKATVQHNEIINLPEIINHFEELKPAMYGEGRVYFSIVENVDFYLAKKYGDTCVEQGTYPYGAVAKDNNNCSRFITRMLMKASPKYHFWHGINIPETIKASPISNVVNTAKDGMVYSFTPKEGLKSFKMNRWQSFWFLVKQLRDNVYRNKANLLPNDQIIGAVDFRSKPIVIPKNAMYLGGVGDGAWYSIKPIDKNKLTIKRYTSLGELEYIVIGKKEEAIDFSKPWKVAYDSHLLFTHIEQGGVKYKIHHVERVLVTDQMYKDATELYA